MKFVLFVEGHTERKAVPILLKQWLDERLNQKIGIKPVRFDGWSELVKDLPVKTRLYLHGPASEDTIAVIGLLDLYGPTFYPPRLVLPQERIEWGTRYLQERANDERFRMFFAVHELEAWLLSDPTLFPVQVQRALPASVQRPETVDFETPPKKLLASLYWAKQKKHYRELVDGGDLFSKLKPAKVYEKCPYFAHMLDEMVALARDAGF